MWTIEHHFSGKRYVSTLLADDGRRITASFSQAGLPDSYREVADPWPAHGHDVPPKLRREWATEEVRNLCEQRGQRHLARLFADREGVPFGPIVREVADEALVTWASESGIRDLSASEIRERLPALREAVAAIWGHSIP